MEGIGDKPRSWEPTLSWMMVCAEILCPDACSPYEQRQVITRTHARVTTTHTHTHKYSHTLYSRVCAVCIIVALQTTHKYKMT